MWKVPRQKYILKQLKIFWYEGVIKNYYFFFTKTYAVGKQKNHLNEMVLLDTPNTC